ncbi:tRNA pseudouridine 38/39 synthase, partial [Taenia solium]
RFTKRRVALKVLYLGWDYCGLVRQELNKSTVAEKLIEAFSKCRMIEQSTDVGFAVCGRTDKGVSGLSQVVVLTLRSNAHDGVGVIAPEDTSNLYPEKPEIDYVLIGNKNLPPDIRILAWCPVPLEFSPRRDCISRSYKYFFPAAGLNIEDMRKAASKLIGPHDFRNFCSSQITRTRGDFVALIFEEVHFFTIKSAALLPSSSPLDEVIDALLDVQKMPGKPPYQMAEAEPLLFFEPEFQKMDWETSPVAQEDVLKSMQKLWTKHAIRAQVAEVMLQTVEKMFPDCIQNNYFASISREALLSVGSKRKPILERPLDDALEEKIQKLEADRPHKQINRVTDV